MPTFWNKLSVPALWAGRCKETSHLSAYEDGTNIVLKHRHRKFRGQGINKKKADNIQNMAKD
jgi:hypothetical protein